MSREGVVLGPPTMLIRSVLDAFDARLDRSGLRCETRAVRPSGPFEMVVVDRSGPDARLIVGSLVPALGDLAGPLRDRLAAVIATRTLEARLTLVGQVRRGVVHDADGNIVATVALFDAERAPIAAFAPRSPAAAAFRSLWAEIAQRLWPDPKS